MLKKAVAVLLVLAILPTEALACTEIYIGANLTADGTTIFARLEEYVSDEGWPKLFDVVPEGVHAAGEVIQAVMDSPGPSPMTVTATRRSATTTARGFARTAEGHMRILPIRQAGQTAKA